MKTRTEFLDSLPSLPDFDDTDRSADRVENLFESYKVFALLAARFASIDVSLIGATSITRRNYDVLVGLLQRFARLMLSNLKLSSEGRNRETIGIIDRSILESVIKFYWLCKSSEIDRFERFVADGFKGDIELLSEIEKNISASGKTMFLEDKMKSIIEKRIANSGYTIEQLSSIKKMPDVATLSKNIIPDRILYIIEYKLGSHYIHGTWNDVMANYLEFSNGVLVPRQESRPVHELQYVHIITYVGFAIGCFLDLIWKDYPESAVGIEKIGSYVEKVDLLMKDVYDEAFSELT